MNQKRKNDSKILNLRRRLREEQQYAAGLKQQLTEARGELADYKRLDQAVEPLIMCGVPFPEQVIILNAMFVAAVENAADDELDNYTAKNTSPVFLGLSQFLLNVYRIPTYKMLTES